MAPEIMKKSYNNKVDMWACGVMLYTLLSGNPPFSGNSDTEILDSAFFGYFHFDSDEWKKVSEIVKDLIEHILEKDYVRRFSAMQALNHPWIVKYFPKTEIALIEFKNIILNMKSFKEMDENQYIMLNFLINVLLFEKEKKKFLNMFQMLDSNGKSSLNHQEIAEAYKKLSKIPIEDQEIKEIKTFLDVNHKGNVDFQG